jgi:thiosulfate/3-mercaptopyruvate sulfurtransferase
MITKVYHTLIQVEDLARLYRISNLVILDCRYMLTDIDQGRKDFLKGHIPGACFMDIGHDLSSPVVKGITWHLPSGRLE